MERKYKYIMLILITAILILFVPTQKAKADTYTDSYGNWTYSVNGSSATITGYSGSATVISIPNIISGYPVTSIGSSAFQDCSSLTTITIPNSVTSIGTQAFYNCSSLTTIMIPDSVTSIGIKAFYNCSSLTTITIPDSVTSIGSYAFYNCSSLTTITIPNSVTSIGDHAFSDCSGLTTITIPNSVTSIGVQAFYKCSGLTTITIPNSVTSIDDLAFYYCRNLTTITIPNSVTSIGEEAFGRCISLTTITIPNSVTSIGDAAFYNCSSLASITIANANTTFGTHIPFIGCLKLNTITIYASDFTSNNVKTYFDNYVKSQLPSATLNVISSTDNTFQTAEVSAFTLTPDIGDNNLITLTVKKSDGSIDTDFSGEHNVSISGVKEANDNTYGKFNGIDLTSEAALISPLTNPNYGQTIKLNFVNGKATANLILNTAGNQSIGFYVDGVRNPLSNTININPKLIASTGLIITAGDGKVDLSWNGVSDAESYKIYEGTHSGVYGTTPVKTVTAPTTSAAITGLANGSTYYFKINASKIGVSDGPNSSEVSVVTLAPITDLSNTGKTSSTVTFNWTAAIGATGVVIEQSEGSSNTWTAAVTSESTINVNAVEATVSGLTPGSSYKFRLVVTGGANAGVSNEVTVITNTVAISDFRNTGKTNSTADFEWTQANGATGIMIEQSEVGSSTWTAAVTSENPINVSAGTATVTGLTPGSSYKFRLVVTGGTNEGNSNEVTVTTNTAPITDFSNTGKTSNTATFTWTVASGATGIVIEQSEAGSNTWRTAVTTESSINVNARTATVTSLLPEVAYKFRLVVTDGANAGNSNEVTVTTNTAPISDFSNTVKTSNTATFAWTAASGATGIVIEQSEAGSNTWRASVTRESSMDVNARTVTVTGLTPGSDYKFRLVVTGGVNAGNSNEVTVTTNTAPITDFSNTGKTSNTATFTWTVASGATGIVIEKSEVESNIWRTAVTTESSINVNARTATVTNLSSAATYKFRLVVTGGANAGNSNEVIVSTNSVPISDLSNTGKTSNTATFTWTPASGATGIVIEQSEAGSNIWRTAVTTESSINVNAGAATVTSLSAAATYKFRLIVTGGSNAGSSNIVTVTLEAAHPIITPTTPVPINDLTSTAGDGQVTLNFTAPVGSIGVVVQLSTNGANYVAATTTSAITAASTNAVVTGLTNGITYNFRILVTGGSYAGISNVTTATPIAVVAPPPTPVVTVAPSEANIIVVNNIEGVQDIITVTGLSVFDTVKVYDALTGGNLLGAGTAVSGQISVSINIAQLGVNAGNVYVSVTSLGKTESIRTGKAYAAEIRNSSLSVSTAVFDKNINKQADIDVYVNFNGNILTGISNNNGSKALINGTDYIVNGNIITIKKGYLLSQNAGSFVLIFNFSSGNVQSMTVTIVNTTTAPIEATNNDSNDKDDKDDKTSTGSYSGGNEVRTVEIFAGTEGNGTPVKVEIKRTIVDGSKIDTVKLDTSNIQDAIRKVLAGNKKEVIIQITDLKDNPADTLEIEIPKASADKLAENGITLKIDAAKAKMEIPEETLKVIAGDVKISINEVTDKSKIDEAKVMALEIFGDVNGEIKAIGNPIEVKANYIGKTEITIPLKIENLPKDPAELKKFLDSLAVHIKHSNGEIVTEKGKIVYDEKGSIVGISITVDSFSTFTIVSLSKEDMGKLTANNGFISNKAAGNNNGNNNSKGASNTVEDSSTANFQSPEIKFVGLGHSPLVEGDKEDFIISSGYDGNVQYRIYLNVDGVWQEVTNGYSAAVSGKDTFTITPDYAFAKGQYQGRVYVKKTGTTGSKQENEIDFDNYYTYNINCVEKDDENRVYTIGNLEITNSTNTGNMASTKVLDSAYSTNASKAGSMNVTAGNNDSFKVGEKVTITGIEGISGIPGPYYYRLHIYDVANDKWTNNVIPYSEKLEWTPSALGTYVLDIHVITANSVLWDNVQENPTLIYGGYEGWKLKAVKVNN